MEETDFPACLSSQSFTCSNAENTATLGGASKQPGERCVEMSKLQARPAGHSSPTVLRAAPILVASGQPEVRHCSVFPYAVLSLGMSLVIVIYDLPSIYLVKSGLNIPGNSSLQEKGWSSHGNSKGVELTDSDSSHHPSVCQEETGDTSAHMYTSKILSLHQHYLKAGVFEDKYTPKVLQT